VIADAVLSADGQYRYRLERQWSDGPAATWVMLNPSVADASIDDPTLNRCISFSRRAGMGRLLLVNLYALRSTDPAALARHSDPQGPLNAMHVRAALHEAQMIVAAWGAHPMALRSSLRLKLSIMAPDEVRPVCLGYAGKRQPRHPGRIAASSEFEWFAWP
jgi:hypothetical protein